MTILLRTMKLAFASTDTYKFVQIFKIKTRGAAGFEYFQINGKHYLASANFFTSNPGRAPSMKTKSDIYRIQQMKKSKKLKLKKIESFPTVGAHGFEFFEHNDESYLAVPNYYGSDSIVYRWLQSKSKFNFFQRISSDGAGSIDSFDIPSQKSSEIRCILGIAEFNIGIAALYILTGSYPNERFVPWQRISSPGVGTLATIYIGEHLLLLTSSYVTQKNGWQTRSQIFYFKDDKQKFVLHHDISTVGAHDVETLTTIDNRYFAFFSNDKNQTSTYQHSELFEWVPGSKGFLSGRFVSRQRIFTNGAHAAEFFQHDNKYFLAIANLGNRQTNKYRTLSQIYYFDHIKAKLTLLQEIPTLGATDMEAFTIKGITYLAVSNEQDDELGADIGSTLWKMVYVDGEGNDNRDIDYAKKDEL